MRPGALHVRLTVLLAVILVPAGAIWIGASLRGARAYHQEITQRTDAGLARNLIAELRADAEPAPLASEAAMDDLVKMLAMAHPGVEIYLLGPDGGVLHAPPEVTLARTAVDLAPVRAFVRATEEGGDAFPLLGTDPRRGGTTVFSAASLPEGGWMYVVLTDETRASLARSVRTSTSLALVSWAGGLGLVTLLGIAAVAFSLLTRRLRALSREVRAFAASDTASGVAPSGVAPSSVAASTGSAGSGPGGARRPRQGRARRGGQPQRAGHARRGDEIEELSRAFRDLAARVRAQVEELERADAVRRELVVNVSHDLRTPLTALQGALEASADAARAGRTEDADRLLQTARRNADRLERLTESLFDLARIDGSAPALRTEPFAVAELVHDVVAKFADRAQGRGVSLHVAPPGQLPLLSADVGQVERALSNLLDNAIRHTPRGGRVDVRIDATRERLRIAVEDTGEGIPDAHVARVFDRFHQVAPERGGHGAGLGLAIARRIVELHGGEIHLRSELGRGTHVRIELPLAGPEGPETPLA
ncbi:MAG: HAMP domain-containing sensor histidine kinase [Trueperaceae bacterium]|nr:HAMP domain-containing sensor histidine kinase [Trueperaceae bacterium]